MTPSTERIPFIFKGMFYAKLFMLFNNIGGKLFFSKTSFRKKNKTTKKPSKPLQKNKRKKNKYRNKENYSLMNQNIKCRLHGDLCLLKDV